MPGDASGLPPFIAPMLAASARQLPPDADQWTAEVKWDGLRAMTAISRGRIRIWSRAGRDIAAAYPELDALSRVAGRTTLVLDGEVVGLSAGRPDFASLQRRMTTSPPPARLAAAVPVTLIVFDLLRVGSRSLLRNPDAQRRALLDGLGLAVPGVIEVPPAFPVMPRRCWRRPLPKNVRALDVLVGGWLPGGGHRARLPGSLLVGAPARMALSSPELSAPGSPQAALRELALLLSGLEQPASPFSRVLPPSITRYARWASPGLAAEVAYLERSPAGRLRHLVWRGLRSG